MERLASGELEFRRPDGRLLPAAPLLPQVPAHATDALCEQNVNAGARLHDHTLRPDWYGERLDLGYAIDVMHPRAIGH